MDRGLKHQLMDAIAGFLFGVEADLLLLGLPIHAQLLLVQLVELSNPIHLVGTKVEETDKGSKRRSMVGGIIPFLAQQTPKTSSSH